jgi:hypothetical protein
VSVPNASYLDHLKQPIDFLRCNASLRSAAGTPPGRSQMLESISGLSPYVHDALVVYAGGGVSVEQIRKGARYVAELQREMDRTRRERLQSLGFEPAAASQMSAYHTKNFM